MRIMIYEEEK
ncbi:hypothetical protein JL09_g6604 [Pichia kudriavzevii]|uniref:Uncharacterized protein n=1 Tax=Pichia kudriavzevii TaxID=4909 RepID=A0A099NPH6_PICKU|nr:hypothetical protein JL09_g6616 [Pichia kudriavzevii]KGK33872.1 hypothetical protein JL09_g6604 [Pichia kudriavzevii]